TPPQAAQSFRQKIAAHALGRRRRKNARGYLRYRYRTEETISADRPPGAEPGSLRFLGPEAGGYSQADDGAARTDSPDSKRDLRGLGRPRLQSSKEDRQADGILGRRA